MLKCTVCLTNLVKHLVALIQNEAGDGTETQLLVADQSVKASGCGDDNVRVSLLVRQELLVLLDVGTTIEDRSLDIRHILAETLIFVADLECKLAGVAHDEHGDFASNRLNLLQSAEDEDGGLSETRFRLAEDVGSEDGLRDANLLDCRFENVRFCSSKCEVCASKPSRGASIGRHPSLPTGLSATNLIIL